MANLVDIKDRMAKDADSLLLNSFKHLTDAQVDEVMQQLMSELNVEHRKSRMKPTYYFAEVVSIKDQNREILFLNKSESVITGGDVEKLATYSEKVRAPRSILITLGEIGKDAEKEGHKQGVRLLSGKDFLALLRKTGLDDLILKDFARDFVASVPMKEESTLEGQLMIGVEMMQGGDLIHALEHFDRAISTDSKAEIAWRLKGNVLDQLGHHEKALECYSRALELSPNSSELWYAIGASMYAIGRYDEELQAYDKALQIDPQNEKALMSSGTTLLKLQKFKDSLDTLEKLIKINPKLVKAHNNKGIALRNLERLDAALEAFDEALALDPDFAEAWSNKGSLFIQMGKFEQALPCFEHLVVLRPDMYVGWKTKGDIESRLGRRAEAIKSFEKALELSPTSAEAKQMLDFEKSKLQSDQVGIHDRISSIFGKIGVEVKPSPVAWEEPKHEKKVAEEAKAEVTPEVAPEPEPVVAEASSVSMIIDDAFWEEPEEIGESLVGVAEEVFGDAAELMILMKRPDEALAEIEKGIRLEPLSVKMNILRGVALHAIGKDDGALASFQRVLELSPNNSEAIYSIEYLLSAEGKYEEAEEALLPILDGNKWIPEILAAMDCAAAGKIKKVGEHTEVAVSLEPSAIAWNYKGLLDLDQGDFEKSIEAFNMALELESVFSDPSNNIGVAHFKLGDNDEASNHYDRAVSSQPRNHIAWNNRGVLLSSLQRYKEAQACFDQSLLLQRDPLVMINKGFMLLSSDSLDEALKTFDEALMIRKTPEGHNDRGITLSRMNRIRDAVDSFKAALSLAPEFQDAKDNYEKYKPMAGKPEKKKGAEEEVEMPPESPEEVWKKLGEVDEPSLNHKKKTELVDICKALGVSMEGTKKDLIERILAAYSARDL